MIAIYEAIYDHEKCGLCIAEVHVKMQLSIHIDFIFLSLSRHRISTILQASFFYILYPL